MSAAESGTVMDPLEAECQQCGKVDVLDESQGSICYMCFLVNGEEEE